MRPKDIRIGNMVRWHKEPEPNVVPFSFGHWLGINAGNYNFNDCEAVHITKEHKKYFPRWLRLLNYVFKIKELHRAQNLYHAIKGEDLNNEKFYGGK